MQRNVDAGHTQVMQRGHERGLLVSVKGLKGRLLVSVNSQPDGGPGFLLAGGMEVGRRSRAHWVPSMSLHPSVSRKPLEQNGCGYTSSLQMCKISFDHLQR